MEYGTPSTLPIVPGHEVVGKVEKASDSGQSRLKVGDRVGIQPLYSSCLKCYYCNSGKEHLCDSAEITGESVQGGYAEYICANEQFVTKIPDNLNSEDAAPLFCPGVTAYKAIVAADLAKGKTVAIFGVGGVGHLAVQFAKMYGSRVVAVSRTKKHLDVAKRVGADNAVVFQENEGQFLKDIARDEGLVDSAVVFAPSDKAIGAAIKAVKKGGTVVIGVLGDIPEFNAFDEKIIKGTVIGSRKDMEDVIRHASQGSVKVVAESYPLKDANEVLAKLKKSEVPARAVLVP
jgi:propanol-preferring alcohol dehydrogenase